MIRAGGHQEPERGQAIASMIFNSSPECDERRHLRSAGNAARPVGDAERVEPRGSQARALTLTDSRQADLRLAKPSS